MFHQRETGKTHIKARYHPLRCLCPLPRLLTNVHPSRMIHFVFLSAHFIMLFFFFFFFSFFFFFRFTPAEKLTFNLYPFFHSSVLLFQNAEFLFFSSFQYIILIQHPRYKPEFVSTFSNPSLTSDAL
ncbi:hypothetical protein ASPWEDRAFT_578354 [Aspergillus wentii DTO 134E9]|uniref:Uncharacterized protein n=1 Tax=Aspergillus wentii DTO 134E9 TaxID=1073089 RepID=A0A1L9RHD3_ASPWE|nr:uncharacterized protein ASPWEDRAFT_578354 [Aspergillus wentii DTO 134E9]OJJ34335.1 hypothetical protein ASPWEDRAFT_578354 [Aspergillus wentii DTO 134E9]